LLETSSARFLRAPIKGKARILVTVPHQILKRGAKIERTRARLRKRSDTERVGGFMQLPGNGLRDGAETERTGIAAQDDGPGRRATARAALARTEQKSEEERRRSIARLTRRAAEIREGLRNLTDLGATDLLLLRRRAMLAGKLRNVESHLLRLKNYEFNFPRG